MQEALDMEKIEYKKLAKWDIQNEDLYKNLTCYEYNFQLWALMNYANSTN